MKYTSVQLTFQEVPDEISLCFLVSGCPLKCPGCHSSDSWNGKAGLDLNQETLSQLLDQHSVCVTCVCFMGGEWQEEKLIELCSWVQKKGLKTCLYTGLEDVSEKLKSVLDYLKVGPFIKERGGLSSVNTNQRFIDLKNNQQLNHKFQAQGGLYGKAY